MIAEKLGSVRSPKADGTFRGAEIHRPGFSARRADRVDLGSGRPGEAEALPGLGTDQFSPWLER